MTELRNRTNTHKHHGSHREGERHSSIRFYRRSSHQKKRAAHRSLGSEPEMDSHSDPFDFLCEQLSVRTGAGKVFG